MVYAHLGVLVICGVCMSFNMQRRTAAGVHSGQLLYMAWLTFSNKKLKYSEWTRVSLVNILLIHICSFNNNSNSKTQKIRVSETRAHAFWYLLKANAHR